jgi:hypothetical protein
MNAAYVHLALNTFPPVLNVAALVVFALAIVWKSTPTLRAALVLVLLSGLIAIPVYLSGEEAEHLVEELEGVNDVAIHTHEDAGKWALIAHCTQGVVALGLLIWFRNREFAQWAVIVALLVTLWATAVVFRTAYLGGKIKHPETEMVR